MDRPKIHQLRVHLSRVAGCPILGDVAYTKGAEDRGAVGSRMCLHAKELVIPLIGGQVLTFTAKDPFVVDGVRFKLTTFAERGNQCCKEAVQEFY